MRTIVVDGLSFEFPANWDAQKYDDWAYYRRQFCKAREPMKAVDLLAWDPDQQTVWLVEVKDYRLHRRDKATKIHREVADKVLDTLSALLPAAVNANDDAEKALARTLLKARRLRVVLHLEQPERQSKLSPRAIDPADVQQKLRQALHAVDPHAKVAEIAKMGDLTWTVN